MSAAELAASMARIGQVQAHLSAPVSVLIAIVAMGAAVTQGLWLVTRHITVMAHEGAHATMASAVGRKIEGIEFQLNANGVTHHSGSSDALGLFAVTFVGYLGPSLFGIGAAELIRAGHIVAVLWIGLAGLVAIMVSLRKSFGIVTVILAFVLLFLIAGFASVGAQVITAYVVAWFLLMSGIQGIRVRRSGSGDSASLRGMTKIPHGFWCRVWLLCSAAALVFGATLLGRPAGYWARPCPGGRSGLGGGGIRLASATPPWTARRRGSRRSRPFRAGRPDGLDLRPGQ